MAELNKERAALDEKKEQYAAAITRNQLAGTANGVAMLETLAAVTGRMAAGMNLDPIDDPERQLPAAR